MTRTVGNSADVIVTPTGIVVDGTAVLALTNGRADPSEREGGASGLKLPRLSTYLAAYREKTSATSLVLAFDKAVPYRTFFEVVYSAKQKEAGFKRFELLAKNKSKQLVYAGFELPDKQVSNTETIGDQFAVGDPRRKPGADLAKQIEDVKNAGGSVKNDAEQAKDKELAQRKDSRRKDVPARRRPADEEHAAFADLLVGEDEPDPNQPVKLVVAITKTDIVLWSFSGLEGTLDKPALKVPVEGAVAPLRGTLEGIIARRWSGKERTEHSILIMAEGDTPMQRVEEIIGAVRADAGGKLLFPDIMFSSGFE